MNIILISSESRVLLEEITNKKISKNSNIIKYNMLENTIDDILEEAAYVSLFDEEKEIIVKNADFFGKEKLNEKEAEKIQDYLEHPYEKTTLIFTTYESVDKRKSITKYMIENYEYIEVKVPKNYELIQEAKRKLSNYKIDEKTIKYIIEACLGNYDLLFNEISKIKDYFKLGEQISLSTAKEIIPSNVDDNIFKFVDATIKKELKDSLAFLNDFLRLKGDVLQLMNMLLREYHLILYYQILSKRQKSINEMMKELKLQEWQLKKVIQEASRYHEDDIKEILLKIGEFDYNIKSGKQDKNLAFQTFLIDLMQY